MLPCTRIPGGILYPPHGGIAAKRYAQGGKKGKQKFSSQFAGQARKSASNF
jgi:hypothetical protein